jgi:hypothetical protein
LKPTVPYEIGRALIILDEQFGRRPRRILASKLVDSGFGLVKGRGG